MNLIELYHPKRWEDLVGQPKAVAMLRSSASRRGWGGRAFWIIGKSGQGKGCICDLIANELAEPWNVERAAGAEVNPDLQRRWESMSHTFGMSASKSGRVFQINESHRLGSRAVNILKELTDTGQIPSHVVWLFTSTYSEEGLLFDGSEDASPLIGRCSEVRLTTQGLAKPVAAWGKEIAERHGLDGRPVEDYVRKFNDCGGSIRRFLQAIGDGCMMGDAP